MNPVPNDPSGTKSVFSTVQGILPLRLLARFPLQRKVPVLATIGVFSIAALWPSDPPSDDEIWAYRVGFGLGQTSRIHDGPDDAKELAREMSGMRGDEYEMFELGFKDGRKGRSAKYDAPESFERYSQPGSSYAFDMTRELDAMYRSRFDNEPHAVVAEPAPVEESSSPTADYMINSIYGATPDETDTQPPTGKRQPQR